MLQKSGSFSEDAVYTHTWACPILASVNVNVCVFRAGTEIVSRAARDRVRHYLDSLKQYFAGLTFSLTCLYLVHLFAICFNVYWIVSSALTLLAGHLEQHPACKNWAMRHWHSYLSEARYWLFAYGSPDAIALRKHYHLLPRKVQNDFTFQTRAYLGSPGKEAIKWMSLFILMFTGSNTFISILFILLTIWH